MYFATDVSFPTSGRLGRQVHGQHHSLPKPARCHVCLTLAGECRLTGIRFPNSSIDYASIIYLSSMHDYADNSDAGADLLRPSLSAERATARLRDNEADRRTVEWPSAPDNRHPVHSP